jgi:hypothetical protein
VTIHRPIYWWLICSVVVFLVSIVTIELTPIGWQDEVQIVEYGRLVSENTVEGWGMNLDNDQQIPSTSILGSYGSYLASKLSNHRLFGHRLYSLMGALLCSLFMLLLGLRLKTTPVISLLVSLILLLDPLLVQGYRGGRIDVWAIAFVLIAMYSFLQRSGKLSKYRYIFSGVFLGLSVFCWISAILLFPLVIWFFFRTKENSDKVLKSISQSILGFFACFILIIAFNYSFLKDALISFLYIPSSLGAEVPLSTYIYRTIILFVTSLKYSNLFFVAGLISIVLLRDIKFYFAFTLFLVGVIFSGLYEHRIVYYVPYMCVSFLLLFNQVQTTHPNRLKIFTKIIFVIFVYNVTISLVLRNTQALLQYKQRSSVNYSSNFSVIGIEEGDYVLTESWRSYFPLRQIGAYPIRAFYKQDDNSITSQAKWIISKVKNDNNSKLSDLINDDSFFPNWYIEEVKE